MVFAFAFMYFAVYSDNPDLTFDNLGEATLTSFSYFFSGPEITWKYWTIDITFGFVIVVVLLNVVIAIVSTSWEHATSDGSRLFYRYRLDYFFEIQALKSFLSLFCIKTGESAGALRHRNVEFKDIVNEGACIDWESIEKSNFAGRFIVTCRMWFTWSRNLAVILLGFFTFGLTWTQLTCLYFFGSTLRQTVSKKDDGLGEKLAMMESANKSAKKNEELLQTIKAQLDVLMSTRSLTSR